MNSARNNDSKSNDTKPSHTIEKFIQLAAILGFVEVNTDNLTRLDFFAIKHGAIDQKRIVKKEIIEAKPFTDAILEQNIAKYKAIVREIHSWNKKNIHELIFLMNLQWKYVNYSEDGWRSCFRRDDKADKLYFKPSTTHNMHCRDHDPLYDIEYAMPEYFLFTNKNAKLKDVNLHQLKSAPFDKKLEVNAMLYAMDENGYFMVRYVNQGLLGLLRNPLYPWHRWEFTFENMNLPSARYRFTDHALDRMKDPKDKEKLNFDVYLYASVAKENGLDFNTQEYDDFILEHVKPRGIKKELVYKALNEGVFIQEDKTTGEYRYPVDDDKLIIKVNTKENIILTLYYQNKEVERKKVLEQINEVKKELQANRLSEIHRNFYANVFPPNSVKPKKDSDINRIRPLIESRLMGVYFVLRFSNKFETDMERKIFRIAVLGSMVRTIDAIITFCEGYNKKLFIGLRKIIYLNGLNAFKNLPDLEFNILFTELYNRILRSLEFVKQLLYVLKYEESTQQEPYFINILKSWLNKEALSEPQVKSIESVLYYKNELNQIVEFVKTNTHRYLSSTSRAEDRCTADAIRGSALGLSTAWFGDFASYYMKHNTLESLFENEFNNAIEEGAKYKTNEKNYRYFLQLYNVPIYVEQSTTATINKLLPDSSLTSMLDKVKEDQVNSISAISNTIVSHSVSFQAGSEQVDTINSNNQEQHLPLRACENDSKNDYSSKFGGKCL